MSIDFTKKKLQRCTCIRVISFLWLCKKNCEKSIDTFVLHLTQVLNHTLSIERNSDATLMLRPTIPIVLETIEIPNIMHDTSPLYIEWSFPGSTETYYDCQSTGSSRQCEVTIKGFMYNDRQLYEDPSNWYKITSMLIHNYDQHKYDLAEPKLVLRLKTSNTNSQETQIFGNIALHDIQVRNTMF